MLRGLAAIVEICHASFTRDLRAKKRLAVAGTVAVVILYWAIWHMASPRHLPASSIETSPKRFELASVKR
jgi:hypothetical protein